MSYTGRPTSMLPTSTTARQPSASTASTSSVIPTQHFSSLASRIASKRNELENLKQLQSLSREMVSQMSVLEDKLATLRDGTEAVACVLDNWDNVLRAISMASMKVPRPTTSATEGADGVNGSVNERDERDELPVTLVRIPTQSYSGGG